MSTRENPPPAAGILDLPHGGLSHRTEPRHSHRQPQRSDPPPPSAGQPPESDTRIATPATRALASAARRSPTNCSRSIASNGRQGAELERWQAGHEHVIESCRETMGRLEQVHASLMGELANYVEENYENLLEGDFSLSDFVDRFGPRLCAPEYNARRTPSTRCGEGQDRVTDRSAP